MNGPWHTVHAEQMFLIIVVVVITVFFFFPSEVHAAPTQMKGITSTLFLEQHVALKLAPSCSEPRQYGRQFSP